MSDEEAYIVLKDCHAFISFDNASTNMIYLDGSFDETELLACIELLKNDLARKKQLPK